MADNRPIGIFDSGLGGLTVVREIIKILPNEDLVYLGDTARVPYGTRSKETIIKFSFEDAEFLLTKNVKCIIIACNTASSVAASVLKKELDVPVFDVIGPALRDARMISGNGKIGMIGTRATVASGAYKDTFGIACPLLVPFIEEGEINSGALELVVKNYLKGFEKTKIKALILGCTHYPIIEELIRRVIGGGIKLVNPEKSVSIATKKYLIEHKMLSDKQGQGRRTYFVTDLTDRFKSVAEMFLGHSINGYLKKVIIG